MADSVPDPKLDDVLSSVRRLVSQEIPKRQPSKATVEPGALVLTSQDRIEADTVARSSERTLEQRIAELEAAVDSGSEEFEPDGSEDQAQHRPDRIVYTRPRPSEESVNRAGSTLRLSEIALIETGTAQEADAGTDAPVEFRRGGLAPSEEAPMAVDVPTLPPVSAEVRAFSDPDDVVARIEARIERGGEADAPQAESQDETLDEETFDAELTAAVRASMAEAVKTDPTDTDRLEAALLKPGSESESVEGTGEVSPAAPETKSVLSDPNEVQDHPDPAAALERDEGGQASPPSSQVVTRILTPEEIISASPSSTGSAQATLAKPDNTALSELPEAQTDAAGSAGSADVTQQAPLQQAEDALGALPDEDAMRLLVARLLREELQGDLGERITRNVRKLVRREVLRIMNTRELE